MGLLKLKVALPMRIRICTAAACLLFAIMGCRQPKNTLPFYNSADFTAEWIRPSDELYTNIHTIDTFALKNQLGHLITKDSLDGFIYVANFFFTTCPGICPKMTGNLEILQDKYAKEKQFKLVSFSVMPWIDTVSQLKEYGELHHINPAKWYLLTGKKERIYQLGRQSYFSERRLGLTKDSSAFLHTESMLLIDKKGRIRGIYNATDTAEIKRIGEDINLLLIE
jgi:protein SCO1/2